MPLVPGAAGPVSGGIGADAVGVDDDAGSESLTAGESFCFDEPSGPHDDKTKAQSNIAMLCFVQFQKCDLPENPGEGVRLKDIRDGS